MKNMRNFTALLVVVLGTVALNAQNAFEGKFKLTNEVRWGKAVLPAGEYFLTIDSVERPVKVTIHSVDKKTATIALAETSAQASPGRSYVFITNNGSGREVRWMNLSQIGSLLIYKPLSAHERSTLDASQSQTVPVEIAKK